MKLIQKLRFLGEDLSSDGYTKDDNSIAFPEKLSKTPANHVMRDLENMDANYPRSKVKEKGNRAGFLEALRFFRDWDGGQGIKGGNLIGKCDNINVIKVVNSQKYYNANPEELVAYVEFIDLEEKVGFAEMVQESGRDYGVRFPVKNANTNMGVALARRCNKNKPQEEKIHYWKESFCSAFDFFFDHCFEEIEWRLEDFYDRLYYSGLERQAKKRARKGLLDRLMPAVPSGNMGMDETVQGGFEHQDIVKSLPKAKSPALKKDYPEIKVSMKEYYEAVRFFANRGIPKHKIGDNLGSFAFSYGLRKKPKPLPRYNWDLIRMR